MECKLYYHGQVNVDVVTTYTDITNYVADTIEISESYNALGSTLSFQLHTTQAPILPSGGTVSFYVDDKKVFIGRVATRDLTMKYTVYDVGWYLGKSELIYQADTVKVADVIRKAVNDSGIACGELPTFKSSTAITPETSDTSSTESATVSNTASGDDKAPEWFFKTVADTLSTDSDMNVCISRVWIGSTPAEIIEDCIDEVTSITGKSYIYSCRTGEFVMEELSDVSITAKYDLADNAGTFDITWATSEISGSESMEDLVNYVMLEGEWDSTVYIGGIAENTESISKFGKIAKVATASETITDAEITSRLREEIANDKITSSRTVKLWGSPDVVPGVVLNFSSKAYELEGDYRVIDSRHTYTDAGCTMTLELEGLNLSQRSTGSEDKLSLYGFPETVSGTSSQTGCETSAESTSETTSTGETVVSGKAWDGSIYASGKNPDTDSRLGKCTVMQWSDRIVKYTNMFEVPADMIAAMMVFESNGNPKVGSRTDGADSTTSYGLLQWKPVYYKKYMSPDLPQTPSDPDQAIYTACCALRSFFKSDTDGVWCTTNWKRALYHYGTGHAGLSNGKWLQTDRFGMIPNYLSCYSTPSQSPSPYAASGKWTGSMYGGGITDTTSSTTTTTTTTTTSETVECTTTTTSSESDTTSSTSTLSSDAQTLVDKLCSFELSCVGVIQEPPANPVAKYGYGSSGDQWCSWFQSYCFGKTGLYPTYGCRVGEANAWRRWAQSKGVWHWRSSGYIPRKGDIVIWTSGGESAAKKASGYISGHIGLIVASNGTGQGFKEGQIEVVEGNAASYYTKHRYKLWDGSSGKYVCGWASWFDLIGK